MPQGSRRCCTVRCRSPCSHGRAASHTHSIISFLCLSSLSPCFPVRGIDDRQMWDGLAGVPAKFVNCLNVHDVPSCQQVCRNWRKASKWHHLCCCTLVKYHQTYVSSAEAELETVVVEYAKPAALSSFANLKHLRIYNCLSALPPQCLTTLTALHSLHILSGLRSVDFPWTTLSSLTSLKLYNSFCHRDSAQIIFPESLHTLHINNPGKMCLQPLPWLAELVITDGPPDSQILPSLTGLTQLSFKARGHLQQPEKAAIFSALAKLESLVHLVVDASPSSRQVKGLTSLSKLTSLELLNLTGEEETLCKLDALRHLLSMVNLQRLTCWFCADGRSYVAETTGQPKACDSFGAGNLSDDTSESDAGPVVAFYLMSPVSTLKLAVHDETASDSDAESLHFQHSDSD